MDRREIVRLTAIALAFGAFAAVVKGQSSAGVSVVARLRSDLGNLSTPWVLIAWYAGSRSQRLPIAIALGLGVTLTALVGFYIVSGVVEPAGGRTVLDDVGSWISANRVYFVAGCISGPVFGLLGGWWARRRSPSPWVVVGLLLTGEPLVLWASGAIFPHGVLSPLTGLPLVVRIVPGFGLTGAGTVSMVVHAVELSLGVAIIALAIRSRRRRERAASPLPD